MRLFMIILGVIVLGFAGLTIYAYTLPTPQSDVEEVISNDRFPN